MLPSSVKEIHQYKVEQEIDGCHDEQHIGRDAHDVLCLEISSPRQRHAAPWSVRTYFFTTVLPA